MAPEEGNRFVQHGGNPIVDGRVERLYAEQFRQSARLDRQVEVPAADGSDRVKIGARNGHVNEVHQAGAQQG